MQSSPRFYWLDLMRFLAAFSVVVVHARGMAFVEFGALAADQKSALIAAAYACTRIGHEAVIVFFVLSGFLVGGRAWERIAGGTFRPTDYAVDRFTRIALPLVPALLLTAVIGFITDREFNATHLLGNLLSLQGVFVPSFGGNAPLWSLAYEVWFYVLAGAIGVALLKSRMDIVSATLIVLVFMIFTSLSPVYLFSWLIGAFAYVRSVERVSRGYLVAGVVLSLYGILCLQIESATQSVSVGSIRNLAVSRDLATLLLSSGIALLIQQLSVAAPRSAPAVRLNEAGTSLAAFSYTLYLTHYPLLLAMSHFGVARARRIDGASLFIYFAMIAFCLACAWVLYWLFEKRTPAVRRALRAGLAQVRLRPSAISHSASSSDTLD